MKSFSFSQGEKLGAKKWGDTHWRFVFWQNSVKKTKQSLLLLCIQYAIIVPVYKNTYFRERQHAHMASINTPVTECIKFKNQLKITVKNYLLFFLPVYIWKLGKVEFLNDWIHILFEALQFFTEESLYVCVQYFCQWGERVIQLELWSKVVKQNGLTLQYNVSKSFTCQQVKVYL